MTHKEFFKVLIGNPPPEIEFEILMKQRETEQMPDKSFQQGMLGNMCDHKIMLSEHNHREGKRKRVWWGRLR